MEHEAHEVCEPKADAEAAWTAHTAEIHQMTLMAQGDKVHSWMMGANLGDRKARVLIYFGGANNYYDKMRQSAEAGFPEVEFRRSA
jgi:cyclohexanone monooxygenase